MPNEVAGLGRRMAALLVDLLMLKLADLPLSRMLREVTPSPVAVLALEFAIVLVYATVFINRRGQTPGKIMTGLRVISADGGMVTQGQAFVRALVKWTPIFGALILLAALNPLPADPHQVALDPERVMAPPEVDPNRAMAASIVAYAAVALGFVLAWIARRHPDRQALHDRIAGTLVMRI